MFDRFTRTLRPLIVRCAQSRCAQSMALPSPLVKASALSLLATASLTLAAQAPVATITSASPVTTGVAGLTASVPVQSGATYAWTISGGTLTAGATAASVTYTAGATGTLTLGCTVTASDSTTATGTKSISVVAAPVATITAASTVTTGTVGLNASVPAQNGATFAWTISGGTITTGATAVAMSYTAGPVGTISIGCTVTNTAGTSATGTKTVTVVAPPTAPVVTAASPVTTGVTGQTASASTQSGVTYTWTATGATITAGQGTTNMTYTPGAVGTATLSCKATNAAGTFATGSASVTVIAAPIVPVITSASPVATGATGLTASIPAQSGMTYAWAITGGTLASGQGTTSVTYSADVVGIVTLSCTATNAVGTSKTGTAAVMATSTGVMDISGTYHDGFGATFTVYQNGTSVWSTRTWNGGGIYTDQIQGTISGTTLSGTISGYDNGTVSWTFASDASSFTGYWIKNGTTTHLAWTGTKQAGVSVQITPTSALMTSGASQSFQAYVAGSFDKALAWSATNGGLVDANGVFTAPAGPGGNYVVTAASHADATKSASAVVMATPTGVMDVSGTYKDNYGITFTLFQSGSSVWGTRIYSSVTETITATISNNVVTGSFSGTDGGFVNFIWTFAPDASSYSGLWASGTGTPTTAWTATKQAGVSVQITPTSALMATGTTQPFLAYVAGAFNKSITWATTAGSIDATGVLTAPPAPGGNFTVTATSAADTSKSATAKVMATPSGIMDVSGTYLDQMGYRFTLFQDGAHVWGTRATGTFNATMNGNVLAGVDNDSGGTVTVFTWTFAPDASTYSGLYAVAPATPNLAWTGTKQAGVSVQISPASALMQTGATQAFRAYIAGSFDKTTLWTATNGTVDATGLLTAPPAPGGNFTVTATSGADSTKSATAKVMATVNGIMDVSGTYTDQWGYVFTLFQSGTHVWGTRATGTFDATVSGNVLAGVDKDANGTVTVFSWTFAPDASSYSGLYAVAPATPNLTWTGTKKPGVSLQLSPLQSTLTPTWSESFLTYVAGAFDKSVSWSVQEAGGGTVSANGSYTAPGALGTFHVIAAPVAAPTITGTATIQVAVVGLETLPVWNSLRPGASATFTATIQGVAVPAVTWSVQEGAAGGAVDASGHYTAPLAPGTYHVVATSLYDPTVKSAAVVQVGATANAFVTITPYVSQLGQGGTQQFTATVTDAANPAVTWSCSGGTIGTNGLYTAPSSYGNYTVTATSVEDPTATDTVTVIVSSGTGTDASFTYDGNGNMTSDGSRSFEYDTENRLTAVTIISTGHRSEFGYDGFGRRVEIVEKDNAQITQDTKYVWEGTEMLESRSPDGGTTLQKYFGQGFLDSDGTVLYYTKDHLGSVRELVDMQGAVRARYDYDPYGRMTKVSGDRDSAFGYTGHFWHAQSGLFLTLFRAYDPNLGRWISRDPIEEKGGVNMYAYVYNSPVNGTDPLGLFMPQWHYRFTYDAARAAGMSYRDSVALAAMTANVDFLPNSQDIDPQHELMHALQDPKSLGYYDPYKVLHDYIQKEINEANKCPNDKDERFYHLALALHAAQDFYAGSHGMNFYAPAVGPFPPLRHIINDAFPSQYDKNGASSASNQVLNGQAPTFLEPR